MKSKLGKIHIYCGDGKGKTTAAMGLALRAAGNGLNVVVAQFLKDGDSGEISTLKTFENVTVITGKEVKGFTFTMTQEQKKILAKGQNEHLMNSIILCNEGKCDVLILDEVLDVLNENLIDRSKLINFLKTGHEQIEVVLTGRNPNKELVELADYISDVKKVKHPYDKGVAARKGIEL